MVAITTEAVFSSFCTEEPKDVSVFSDIVGLIDVSDVINNIVFVFRKFISEESNPIIFVVLSEELAEMLEPAADRHGDVL